MWNLTTQMNMRKKERKTKKCSILKDLGLGQAHKKHGPQQAEVVPT